MGAYSYIKKIGCLISKDKQFYKTEAVASKKEKNLLKRKI